MASAKATGEKAMELVFKYEKKTWQNARTHLR